MSTIAGIKWPSKATHAMQIIAGVTNIVAKRNADTLNPDKPFEFGIWQNRVFSPVKKEREAAAAPVAASAPVVVTAAGVAPSVPVARPAGRPVLSWSGRRAFIAEHIFDGLLTAREIAALVVAQWPEVPAAKALAHVRSTQAHLRVAGYNVSYRKEGGAPVVNFPAASVINTPAA